MRYFLKLLLLCSLASCTVKNLNHGYEEDSRVFENIKPKVSTMSDVRTNVGPPSLISSFDENTWFYVTLNVKQVALFPPKVVGYRVAELKFKNQILQSISFDKSEAVQDLKFLEHESPVHGDDTGALKDFVHNLGRFNKGASGPSRE